MINLIKFTIGLSLLMVGSSAFAEANSEVVRGGVAMEALDHVLPQSAYAYKGSINNEACSVWVDIWPGPGDEKYDVMFVVLSRLNKDGSENSSVTATLTSSEDYQLEKSSSNLVLKSLNNESSDGPIVMKVIKESGSSKTVHLTVGASSFSCRVSGKEIQHKRILAN